MNARVTTIVVGCLLTVAAGATSAQHVESADAVVSSGVLRQIPMFSYRDGVKSDLLFRNTPTGALAEGTARVEYEDGHASISAKVDKLPAPGSLGPYAVYVLWALTPDGRAVKEGVIAGFHGGKGKMTTRYDASEFALIITAEPHFAVASPSTMIVLYNVADDVKGQAIGVTTLTGTDYSSLPRLPFDRPNSPALVQARQTIGRCQSRCGAVCGGGLLDSQRKACGSRNGARRQTACRAEICAHTGARGSRCSRGCPTRSRRCISCQPGRGRCDRARDGGRDCVDRIARSPQHCAADSSNGPRSGGEHWWCRVRDRDG